MLKDRIDPRSVVPPITKAASVFYAQYMSRDDNGKRKYTWIANDTKAGFEAAKKHVVENGYTEEGPIQKMTKAAATDVYRILRNGKMAVGDHVLEDGKTIIRVIKDSAGQLKYKVMGDLGKGTRLESSDIARHTKIQHHAYTKHAADKKYTSLEYTLASSNPFVKALTRNMAADKQKAVWKRYAQIVLRNRNYGRSGHVAGEYIKTKVRE